MDEKSISLSIPLTENLSFVCQKVHKTRRFIFYSEEKAICVAWGKREEGLHVSVFVSACMLVYEGEKTQQRYDFMISHIIY